MEGKKKIKIALFIPWIKSKGGVERIVLSIAKNQKYKCDIYTFFYDKEKTFQEFKKCRIKVLGDSEPKGFIGRGAGLFLRLIFTKINDLGDYDIFMISTAGIAEFITFRNKHKRTVAICHTPLRVAHTMYDYYRNQSLRNKIILPLAVPVYRLLERKSWRKLDYSIVLSREVEKRITDYGLLKREKILDIGPYADYPKTKKKAIKTEKIIFYPSRFIKYKRQDLAVRAFNVSEIAKQGFKLVIAGFPEDRKYFQYIKSMENSNIIVKENLSEDEISRLYSSCYATIFLAINEDTGLTPLESLAYGKPVISVNEGGPTEFINNGKNGLLVNADEDSIATALKSVTNNKFYSRLAAGARKSKRHDEKRFMNNFNKAISKILKN